MPQLSTRLMLSGMSNSILTISGQAIPIGNPMDVGANIEWIHNSPNPFNSSTNINLSIPYPDRLTLTVHDGIGRQIETILSGYFPAGNYEATWNSTKYPAGTYIFTLIVGSEIRSTRGLHIK